MNKIKFCLIFLSALLMFGCSGSGDGVSSEFTTINGMDAEEFYEQFLYSHSIEKKAGVEFDKHSHSSARWVKINNTTITFLSLYLMQSRSFILEYSECETKSGSTSCLGSAEVKEVLRGQWRVDGATLIIGSIATGEGLQYNDKPAFNVQFSQDINGEGLTEAIFLFTQREYGSAPPAL